MGLKADLQADFDTMVSDFGISTTMSGTTATISAIRNSLDKDVIYSEMNNKSVEYRFTLWYDVTDITGAGASVPDVHDEITISGTIYLVAKRTYDPLEALVALDMVEQYG